MLDRRGFLALAGASALDPERLLWRKGAKTISIPKPTPLPDDILKFYAVSIHITRACPRNSMMMVNLKKPVPLLAGDTISVEIAGTPPPLWFPALSVVTLRYQ
jgi:hypothetical protein